MGQRGRGSPNPQSHLGTVVTEASRRISQSSDVLMNKNKSAEKLEN